MLAQMDNTMMPLISRQVIPSGALTHPAPLLRPDEGGG